MIPTFPTFKKLKLSDRDDITAYVSNFPPYSDFNFVSLWTYNILGLMEISTIFGNLVVKFQDYKSDKFFYSFLGCERISETIDCLLNKSKLGGLAGYLDLVPEYCINNQLHELLASYKITENRDDFDYICSVDELTDLQGGKWRDLRYMVKLFPRRAPNFKVNLINIQNPQVTSQIDALFSNWEKARHKRHAHELLAIKRLLHDHSSFNNLVCLGINIDDTLAAWGVAEIVDCKNAIYHYHEANSNYAGIFEFLDCELAKELLSKGVRYLNFEQDLGIPGLRHYKESLHPVAYLKKYTIERA